MQHHSLSRIYEEIKDDIGYFVRLYRLAKVARMDVSKLLELLEIANNDLPLVEHKCERRKREVDALEAEKRNSARILQELTDQDSNYAQKIRLYSVWIMEKELAQRDQLYQKNKTRRPCKITFKTIMKNMLKSEKLLKKR